MLSPSSGDPGPGKAHRDRCPPPPGPLGNRDLNPGGGVTSLTYSRWCSSPRPRRGHPARGTPTDGPSLRGPARPHPRTPDPHHLGAAVRVRPLRSSSLSLRNVSDMKYTNISTLKRSVHFPVTFVNINIPNGVPAPYITPKNPKALARERGHGCAVLGRRALYRRTILRPGPWYRWTSTPVSVTVRTETD